MSYYIEKRNRIDELQREIDAYGKLSDTVKKKINYKFRLDWNYYSNSMEGNTLTMDETRSVMIGNLTVGGKPFKDISEMKGHDDVISDILKIGKNELRLSESRIRNIHKGIMHEEDESKKKEIGEWKTSPNYVYNYKKERFDYVQPNEVPDKMHDLLNRTNAAIDAILQKKNNAPHPIDVALQFHLDYLLIHPFYDGNGRTARILTNLLLISFGYPPFWIKTNERATYNQYIADIQGYGGSSDLFFDFAAKLIVRSQQLVLDAIEGKEIEEPDDIDKRVAMIDRMLHGLDEEIQKTKSEEVMKEMLEKIVEPLFRKLFEKTLKLAPLFASTEFTYFMDSAGSSHHNINDLMDDIDINWNTKKGAVENIQLNIRLNKLKKLGTKAFDEFDHFRMEFEKHKYVIVISKDEKVERLYHQLISDDKIEEIASRFINNIVSQIEERINKITG